MDETLEAAGRRELQEETGIQVKKLEQLGIFADPGRDPRGRTITVAYLARVRKSELAPRASDDAAEVGWHSLLKPPPLAFDHREILGVVRKLLRAKDP